MSQMRGLVQFIADLRIARARELEEKRINKELANIRTKFQAGDLNGYHRKKYICKLLYIYILGWNVDFGHMEAVNLISSRVYSEKQIGYLAVTLFLHEDHELLHLVVNSIRKDLVINNELWNCMALHAIATVGGKEMGASLGSEVHRLLVSPTSIAFVKKKAALTLLRLYRKDPSVIQTEWTERLIALMDEPDIGVATSVLSLITTLAQDDPDLYRGSYAKAITRMSRIIIEHELTKDYVYYSIPCPWLQIKLLRLLQCYPPSQDDHLRAILRDVLQKIIDNSTILEKDDQHKNVQQSNAQNAILFEVINLIIHLEDEDALMGQILTKMGQFLASRETNIRYLGLQAMTHYTARTENTTPLKKHQNVIFGSLRDRDVSVRRKGLDLLYSMCDTTNSKPIVNELLKYLTSSDFTLREEMVLKIAILTEKYATEAKWYVDISLRLIAIAGEHVSDDVWQRVIQIVTNNESLQVYAASTTLKYIQAEQCHDTLIRIAGYILGEFGHLIAETAGCTPIEQFLALQSKLPSASTPAKAITLSCFIKFANLFPEIKPQLLMAFRGFSHSLDPELQQRAAEYRALAMMPSDDLLRTVCDEMPPFPERSSQLLTRLHQKHSSAGDRRTWILGGKGANVDEKHMSLQRVNSTLLKKVFTTQTGGSPVTSTAQGQMSPTAIRSSGSPNPNDKNVSTPFSLGPSPSGTPVSPQPAPDSRSPPPTPVPRKNNGNMAMKHLSPGWEAGFKRLMMALEGILYEDLQIQIGLRSEYRGAMGMIIFYYTNKSEMPITGFTTTFQLGDGSVSEIVAVSTTPQNPTDKSDLTIVGDGLKLESKSIPKALMEPGEQLQQMLAVTCLSPFIYAPTIRVSWIAGALQALTLKLPVSLQRFCAPPAPSKEQAPAIENEQPSGSSMGSDEFFRRWKQMGAGEREAQRVFSCKTGVEGDAQAMSADKVRGIIVGCGWEILNAIGDGKDNLVGAGVVGLVDGRVGVLVRAEPNYKTKMIRVTIRGTDTRVPRILLRNLEERLVLGTQTDEWLVNGR